MSELSIASALGYSSPKGGYYWRYDQLGRVERTDVIRGKKTKLSEEMVYFDSNEVETLQVTRAGLADRTFSFGYDAQHQLTVANDNLGEYGAAFTFSSSGSGLIENATVANIPGAPQVITRDVSYKYGNHQYVDAHTVETLNNSDGTPFATYLHDLSGNVTHREESGQGVDFEYDGEDRQRRASSSSNYSELYFYDENGQRFLAIEIDPAGSLERSRMWFGVSEFWTNHKGGNNRTMTNLSLGALAVGRVDTDDLNNTSLEYSFHNGLGHLMGTVDESGLLTTAFVYGPFGEIIEQSGAVDSHLRRFNGKEADQLSRLNYYGYRYYDPLSLQWTQADPLFRVVPDMAFDAPRLMSLYTFSLNNPVRYLDPDGRKPGDQFRTPEAASTDFGNTYNDDSIRHNKEYASVIYMTVKAKGKPIFSYSYTVPNRGTKISSMPNHTTPKGTTRVGTTHTHSGADSTINVNKPSKRDRSNSKTFDKSKDAGTRNVPRGEGAVNYAHTPNGSHIRIGATAKDDKLINQASPSDPSDPTSPKTTTNTATANPVDDPIHHDTGNYLMPPS